MFMLRDEANMDIKQETIDSLEKMRDELQIWINELNQNVSECFEDYSETQHLHLNRGITPLWIKCSFCSVFEKHNIHNKLEILKGVEYARVFSNRVYELTPEVISFAHSLYSYEGIVINKVFSKLFKLINSGQNITEKDISSQLDAKVAKFCNSVKLEQTTLEKRALNLLENINLLFKDFKNSNNSETSISITDNEEPSVSITDYEETVLYDMAEYKHQSRIRAVISASTNLDESTTRNVLESLEDKKLIHRPNGPRKGYVITKEGEKLYKSISSD